MNSRPNIACAIVEPRNHCALLDAVANVHESIGCRVDLMHGTENAELAQHVQDRLPKGAVRLHQLPLKDLTTAEYSDMLMKSDFWDRLREANREHSHVLIFQTDSGTCRPVSSSMLQEALKHEYCGAPWPRKRGSPQVGNGGFSLRDIDATRRLLLRKAAPSGKHTAEDVFFSRSLGTCPREVAVRFSAESSYRAGPTPPIGFHAWWKFYNPDTLALCPQASQNHFLNVLHATQTKAVDALVKGYNASDK